MSQDRMAHPATGTRWTGAAAKWPLIVPVVAVAVLGTALLIPTDGWLLLISSVALLGTVICAVHHAEVVAHRIGEPFGTLVLALADRKSTRLNSSQLGS